MPIPNPAASSAVLIGCDTYEHMESLPAVANNLTSLRAMLCDPDVLGLTADRCHVLANPTSKDDVLDAVHEASQQATDMLIVYFAGHGLLDSRTNDLYLAMPAASGDRLFRALRYDDVRRVVMDASRVLAKVVILDCCYSGAALLGGMGGTASMADQAGIEGTYLLTASAETKLALAPVGETYTAFTGEILAALDGGLPDSPDTIDLDALYFHIRHELEAKGRPVPQQRARNGGRSIVLARNRHGSRNTAAPVAKHELPTIPPGYADVVTAAPRIIVDRLSAASPSLRAAVLAAAGARHDDQVVAALIDLLRHTEPTGIPQVCTGIARRPPTEIVAVINALTTIGLRQFINDLVSVLAAEPAHDIAALAAALHAAAMDTVLTGLLDAAAHHTTTPQSLITLVGALSPLNIREHVDHMLAKKAAETPAAGAIVIADALREAGRDEAAYRFYGAAVSRVAQRTPTEVSALIAAMRSSGLPTPHDEIAEATIVHAARHADLCATITAFRAAGLDLYERQALAYAAEHFAPERIATLAAELRNERQSESALQLCIEAATARGAEMTIVLTAALQDAGRPVDANRILDAAGLQRPLGEVVDLIDRLMGSHRDGLALRVAASSTDPQAHWLTDVVDRPIATGEITTLKALFGRQAKLPAPQIIAVTSSLCDRGRPALAARLVELVAKRSEQTIADEVGAALAGRGDTDGKLLADIATRRLNSAEIADVIHRLGTEKDKPWEAAKDLWISGQTEAATTLLTELAADSDSRFRTNALIVHAILHRDNDRNFDAAETLLTTALTSASGELASFIHLHRGAIYESQGRADAASADFLAATRSSNPSCASLATLHLAWNLIETSREKDAIGLLESATTSAVAPIQGSLFLALGIAEERTGRHARARNAFLQAAGSGDSETAAYAAYKLMTVPDPTAPQTSGEVFPTRTYAIPDGHRLWPYVLELERPHSSADRAKVMASWITWLKTRGQHRIIFRDAGHDDRAVTLTGGDQLSVWVLRQHKARRLLSSGKLGSIQVDRLVEMGFKNIPSSEQDPVELWMEFRSAASDATIAAMCDSVLTAIFGAYHHYTLDVKWRLDSDGLTPPRPQLGFPTLLP